MKYIKDINLGLKVAILALIVGGYVVAAFKVADNPYRGVFQELERNSEMIIRALETLEERKNPR